MSLMQHVTSEWENWKHVTIAHCLILAGILTIVIAVYAYVVSKRSKRNAESRELILRGQLLINSPPQDYDEYNFNPLWAGRSAQDIFKQKQDIIQSLPKATGGTGDRHYGKVGDDLIYYRKIMSNSYHVIDANISNSNIQHRQKSYRFVIDYLRILQKEFPQLTREVCEEYIQLYEKARFGDPHLKVGRKEFQKLEKAVFDIISACEEPEDKEGNKDTRRKKIRPRFKAKRYKSKNAARVDLSSDASKI